MQNGPVFDGRNPKAIGLLELPNGSIAPYTGRFQCLGCGVRVVAVGFTPDMQRKRESWLDRRNEQPEFEQFPN